MTSALDDTSPLPTQYKGIPKAIRAALPHTKPAGVEKGKRRKKRRRRRRREKSLRSTIRRSTRSPRDVYSRAYHNTMKMMGDKHIARQADRAAVLQVFGPKASRAS